MTHAAMTLNGDTAVALAIILVIALFQWYGKLPPMQDLRDLADMLNSRGGNIIILTIFSGLFFVQSMRLFYQLLDMVKNQTLSQDNSFALMGLQFATSSAFGMAFGSLLKTMTGESSKVRASDPPITEDGGATATVIAGPGGTTAKVEVPSKPVATETGAEIPAQVAERSEHP
jgi:hypothetical protein